VTGNVRVTEVGKDYDTHHIVLDFGAMPFPVLEGQSIGIVPPGIDAGGRAHHARQYSHRQPRNGERPGYNNLSLTIKRVLEDRPGPASARRGRQLHVRPARWATQVQVIGPFGSSFLMPQPPSEPASVMICTGTGSAPMRAMTEYGAGRLRASGKFEGGKLHAVLRRAHAGGAALLRTAAEPAQGLHRHQLRVQPHTRRAQAVCAGPHARACRRPAPLLADPNACFYVCGLKAHGRRRGAGAA
jgi:benzoyl-CoA 2,3-dioxygenase component A